LGSISKLHGIAGLLAGCGKALGAVTKSGLLAANCRIFLAKNKASVAAEMATIANRLRI
jgi:hypothetical protein